MSNPQAGQAKLAPPHPPSQSPQLPRASARLGLLGTFFASFFQLCGVFMLAPLMLLLLKQANVSTTVAGLFAASNWVGIFSITPFASAVAQKLGRRPTMWLASTLPVASVLGYLATDALWVWFVLQILSGAAGGLRWVLAEAFIAEFAPPQHIGRYMGIYATMIGVTFVVGPTALAWLGTNSPYALWVVAALLGLGIACTALIPKLPADHDAATARVGLAGLWHTLLTHPVIMLAGFVGGFFELGLASILPLYGLALGLSVSSAALLVSVSGAGGALIALPAGMVADGFSSPARGRRTLMVAFTALILLASCAIPWVREVPWLIWAIVCVWGAAGGALYTLAMTDIGARERGITLVNSTSVLVLNYTLGGLVASALSGALIERSATLAFPLMLVGVAAVGVAALLRVGKDAP